MGFSLVVESWGTLSSGVQASHGSGLTWCGSQGACSVVGCTGLVALACGVFLNRDETHDPYIGRQIFATEPPGKP